MRDLADYWRSGCDCAVHSAQLHDVAQFLTEIDGQTLPSLYARSPEPDALPIIITHGYPSSFVEMLEIIGPLTDPRSHGGNPVDAFHVVAPSVPGFGFSVPVAETGWDMPRTARAFVELMRRLGYERYGAQGSDIGAGVAGMLASIDPSHVVGVHATTDPTSFIILGSEIPIDTSGLSTAEQEHVTRLQEHFQEGKGYLQLQSNRPLTLGYSLTDSPVGQLAWIVEPFKEWTNPAATVPDEAVDRDLL